MPAPAGAYEPSGGDYGPPPPRRRRLRLRRFLPHLLIMAGLAAARLGPMVSGSGRGTDDVSDPYARVAAEADRTLVAQGVQFTILDHRPLGPGVCAQVPACTRAASARWAVTGTDLEARSWMFVFADDVDADAAVAVVAANPAIVGAPAPPGWATTGGSPGRFLVLVRVGRPGGADTTGDPMATEAAEALRIYSTDPAVKELIERGED